MNQPVLVAYASKYGATQEIATKIAQVLQAAQVPVAVLSADQVTDLTPYGAVILGSAVYVGRWRKAASRFLAIHESALAQRPVWLFSSGPTGAGDPVELMQGWHFPKAEQPIADRIQPRDTAFFHGALDPQKLNLADKLLVKAVKAPMGDFRDWAAITAWAQGIAAELSSLSRVPSPQP